MELIYQQEYWSFKLPKGTNIILTSNPDSSDYNITSALDEAQKSRMITFNIRFDIDSWSQWAENNEIDSRAINFMLSYNTELLDDRGTHTHIMNPRSYTLFANAISGIQDWSSPDGLSMIMEIASGSFNDPDNIVGSLFTTFIANKLDKLISPSDLLLKPWETVKEEIKRCVYDDNGRYRPDIASILHTRLLNFSCYYFSQPKSKTDVVQDRILKLIEASKDPKEALFTEDFFFDIIKTLIKKFPTRTNKFMLKKEILAMIK